MHRKVHGERALRYRHVGDSWSVCEPRSSLGFRCALDCGMAWPDIAGHRLCAPTGSRGVDCLPDIGSIRVWQTQAVPIPHVCADQRCDGAQSPLRSMLGDVAPGKSGDGCSEPQSAAAASLTCGRQGITLATGFPQHARIPRGACPDGDHPAILMRAAEASRRQLRIDCSQSWGRSTPIRAAAMGIRLWLVNPGTLLISNTQGCRL